MPNPVTLTVERDVAALMRDGTMLYADVVRPAEPGRYPALLRRTPYNKQALVDPAFILRAATAGYAMVTQDVRGRYESEGEFNCIVNERQDGYDTLEWLAAQPWCDGSVGMYGTSYNGLTQWQAAMSGHPALKAIVPGVTAADYHKGWTYQGGAFQLSFNLSWTMTALAPDTILRKTDRAMGAGSSYQDHLAEIDHLDAHFRHLPLTDPPFAADHASYYHDWLAHPAYDDYWEALDVSRAHERLTVPALNIGGWYDIFLQGTIDNFVGMRDHAATPEARARQRLLLGPWNHPGMRTGNPIGEMNFGVHSTGADIDVDGIHLRWFDRWLRDTDNGVDDEPPVRIFVMGVNEWRHEQQWPLARTEWQPWYFHSDGKANSLRGDGSLTRETPAGEPPDTYVANPRNPVPSRGGGMCCDHVYSYGGAFDQRAIEEREDVLIYTSAPLDHALEVIGPIRVILHAASSVLDTDFAAKLVDVSPCGCARNVADGILRARYRNGMQEGELLSPNTVTTFEIDCWSTANMFLAGHRIRVEIASSNFPRFDRNPNTGELPGRSAEMVSALQTVLHTVEYPSHIVLPVANAS